MQDYPKPIQDQMDILLNQVNALRERTSIFPSQEHLSRALTLTPLTKTKVVIVGQDPYHQPAQADGLAFSSGLIPPSLRNIFQELESDVGVTPPNTGRLDGWAAQGVLLLNRILSVEEGAPLSHQHLGWQALTNQIIKTISDHQPFVVFILWGKFAQDVKPWIDTRHLILESVHPSPLSAYRGFFGSKPFSKTNHALQNHRITPIAWERFV